MQNFFFIIYKCKQIELESTKVTMEIVEFFQNHSCVFLFHDNHMEQQQNVMPSAT